MSSGSDIRMRGDALSPSSGFQVSAKGDKVEWFNTTSTNGRKDSGFGTCVRWATSTVRYSLLVFTSYKSSFSFFHSTTSSDLHVL